MLIEQQYKKRFCKEILGDLLARYENSKAFHTGVVLNYRPKISFQRNNPFAKDYQDKTDYRKTEWMHEVLFALEEQEILSLLWEEDKVGETLARVYLNFEALDTAYKMAEVEPKLEKINRLLLIIKPLEEHPWGWLRTFAGTMIDDLTKRKQAGLNLNQMDTHRDVVKVLQYLPHIDGNIPKRVLSRKLFTNPRHYEKSVEQPLAFWLDRAHSIDFTSNTELLAFFGIVQQIELVFIYGLVDWNLNDQTAVSTKPYIGGIGVTNLTVNQMEITNIDAERIVIIENMTSYAEWINQRPNEKELVICTDGYPHLLLQKFLQKVSHYNNQVSRAIPVFHWGDIDIRGMALFNFMKREYFSTLQPLRMDLKTLLYFKERALPTTEAYNEEVADMLENPEYAAWFPVLECMLESSIRLEQESVYNLSSDYGINLNKN